MFDGPYLEWNNKRIKAIIDNYGHHFFAHKKILDLGCGHADISGVLYRLGGNVTAVDARQEHLKIVERKYGGVKLVKADLDRGWPFLGRSFDLTLDLALLCHLNNYEEHLKSVVSSTEYLILETAVANSDDPSLCIVKNDVKNNYEESANGIQTQVSAAAIERVLSECGMNFKRMDNTKLNCGSYRYDWLCDNSGTFDINQRRLWFCQRNTTGVITYSFKSGGSIDLSNNNISALQPLILDHAPTVTSQPSSSENNETIASSVSDIVVYNNTSSNNKTNYIMENVRNNNKKYAIYSDKTIPQFPNLKVLYLPLNDLATVAQGMYDAWDNVGVKLKIFDYHRDWLKTRNKTQIQQDLISVVREFQPTLMHMQLQFTGIIDPHIISECRKICPGIIITNWSGDVRNNAVPEFVRLSSVVDYSLISSTGQLDMYRGAGCHNIKYWQIGYNPKSNFPTNNNTFAYDVCFIGNNYGNTFPDSRLRERVARRLNSVFTGRFGLFGHGFSEINKSKTCAYNDANKFYNQSICTLSISNYNSVSHYFSDRLLHCLASGRPTISWDFPGSKDFFTANEEIFYARSDQEVIDIVNQCKKDMEMSNRIGQAGYQRVLQEHTYTSRVLELIDMVGLSHQEGK